MQRKRTKRELVLNNFESLFVKNDSKIIKIEKNTHAYFDKIRTHFCWFYEKNIVFICIKNLRKALSGLDFFIFHDFDISITRQ